jgi:penicillin-binding protein 2
MFRQKWYAGETISASIGQGALTITPLQLAHAIGGVATGGVLYRPHLVKAATRQEKPRLVKLNPENAQKVVAGLYAVVNEGGTGVRARLPGVSVCGKTGTSQLASVETAKALNLKDNAWFVAFAPCEAPEIVVSALFEHGEHGNLAAPITRDVIKAYFDKKARTGAAASQPAAASPPAPPRPHG